ncbi:MAG: SRPBCC family protein [Candidatus Limnocylindrales bacterium]
MSQILESIEVDVPVRTAYDQWTQFEEFPRFMDGVESIRQIDDTHLEWTASIAGVRKEWRAEITEQTPDQRIAWRATDGAENAGVVTFHRLDDRKSRVTLQLDVEPEGPLEVAGDVLGFIQRSATGDLKRFKAFIEERGSATGAWRGEVEQNDVAG